ncbi:MAG TPA: glycosyltransferase [Bryobacteraceae bacterium]|nr:glycosyltransferase [Bryobacteraceae bacterium]
MSHFALTTFGSLGDLHPYIAVGIGLRNRGHRVTIATSEIYRAKVEGEGLGFHPVRPDLGELREDPAFMERAFHPRKGTEYVFRHLMMPWVEHSYEDLKKIASEADLLVGHPIAFATPIVAEELGKPWISVVLQPAILLSAFDPPSISGAAFLEWFRGFGPGFWRQFGKMARAVMRSWSEPVRRLRRRAGLREVANPLLDDMFSPFGTQAWFSEVLARPQADWPTNTVVTGFPFYDKLAPGEGMSAELRRFLDAGLPPVVFTLGSSAVSIAGEFYSESIRAARRVGCRAVLLVGNDPGNKPEGALPEGICVAEYAPYSELFPRAAAVVHQGGVGTTAQTLRAGVPMCVVPWGHDQPDNARRCVDLGVARVVPRSAYRADRAAMELKRLLVDASFRDAARGVAAVIAREDGVARACDGLESAVR